MKKDTDQVRNAEREASIMLNHAVALSQAANSGTAPTILHTTNTIINIKLFIIE